MGFGWYKKIEWSRYVMANIQGQKKWSEVRLLETHELARGGVNGNLNEQAKALADRTELLMGEKASKQEIVQGVFEFGTYAEFNAAKANLPANCTVVIGEENTTGSGHWGIGNNSWNGSVLKKSSFDPVTTAAKDAAIKATNAKLLANSDTDNLLSTIFFRTENMLNLSAVTSGTLGQDGVTPTPSPLYWVSDFIPVTAGKIYKRTRNNHYVYAYDNNKNPVIVSNSKPYWTTTFNSTMIPEGVAYIRCVVGGSDVNPTSDVNQRMMLVESGVDTSTYIPYFKLRNLTDYVKPEDVFSRTGNLFNKLTVIAGHFGGDGKTWGASSWFTSDYISVTAGEIYKRSIIGSNNYVYAYDANKQPVVVNAGKPLWTNTFDTVTIPEGVAYIRCIMSSNQINTFMLTEGENISSRYIPYYKVNMSLLEGVLIKDEFLVRTKNLVDSSKTVDGYYGEGGLTFISGTYCSTDFIPVEVGKTYKRTPLIAFYVYAYDSNKQPVEVRTSKKYWQTELETTPIPEGVSYIRCVHPPVNKDTFMVTESSVDTSSYIPYYAVSPKYLQTSNKQSVESKNLQKCKDLGFVDNQLFNTDYSHIIFYGQSLSNGHEAAEALTTAAIDGCYMLGNSVWSNLGNNGANTLTPLVAATNATHGESSIVSATNVLKKLLEKNRIDSKLIATNTGESGKTIEQLSKESTNGTNFYTANFVKALNQAKTTVDGLSKTISCPAIVFMQGEYNYTNLTGTGLTPGSNATNDKAAYKALLLTLKNNMQAEVMAKYGQTKKPLFFLCQVGGGYINLSHMPINMAQVEFADENDDVILLNPTYGVPDYNGGHLSSNGYRWYGELVAKQLYKSLLKHEGSSTVRAKEFELIDSTLVIHCEVPNAPLVIDAYTTQAAASSGFRVIDDTGEIVINSVRIVGGTSIVLSLGRKPTTNVYVTYAGYGRSGNGNIRDSDEWISMYSYTDETTYSKKPTYTPKLSDGITLIYGKKYPLQNWLVSFYKKLN